VNNKPYDQHLTRIGNRPGEFLQIALTRCFVNQAMELLKINTENNFQILEIGPGTGRAAKIFTDRNVDYDAIEPTEAMRSLLIENFSGSSKFGSVFPDPLPGGANLLQKEYDLVFATHVLEHTQNQYEAREFVQACMDLLKPGGAIFLVTPDFRDYGASFFDIDWSHGYPTTVNRLHGLLEDVGFRKINCFGTRAGSSNFLFRGLLLVIERITPFRFFDFLCGKLLKERLLATGFSVGFLKLNVVASAYK